jgi:hypothetical protein
MPREILFIADDLGLSEEVDEAILHAHRHGVLQGAALMMGQPGTDHAVRRAREHPTLQIGWHLHLTDSRPCTRPAWPWGSSPAAAGLAIGLWPPARRLAAREIHHQWRSFRSTGLPCRFVNAHHHLHFHPFVRKALLEVLPDDFTGWMRWGRVRFFPPGRLPLGYRWLETRIVAPGRRRIPFALSDTLWGVDRTFAMEAREVARVLVELGDGRHEFLFHPRRVGDADSRCLVELADLLPAGMSS